MQLCSALATIVVFSSFEKAAGDEEIVQKGMAADKICPHRGIEFDKVAHRIQPAFIGRVEVEERKLLDALQRSVFEFLRR